MIRKEILSAANLASVANNGWATGTPVVDNTTAALAYADFYLTVTDAAAATAGGTYDLYVIPSLDGTTYVDGNAPATIAPATELLLGQFVCTANAAEKLVLKKKSVPVGVYCKFVMKNASGQAITDATTHGCTGVFYAGV